MICGREEKNIPLVGNIQEDRYIYYTGKKVLSTKFDLEVMLKDKPNYKVLILVDKKETMELLSKRIGETMGRFAIFSTLKSLVAYNLQIKNDKGIFSIPENSDLGIVSTYIKPGDSMIFELKYEEIWLHVDMFLKCGDEVISHKFSLKIELDCKFSKLKEKLISIAINYFNEIKQNKNDEEELPERFSFSNEDRTYFLLKDIRVEDEKSDDNSNTEYQELKEINETLRKMYNFESKIKCTVEFLNLNETMIKKMNEDLEQIIKFKPIEAPKQLKRHFSQKIQTHKSNQAKLEEINKELQKFTKQNSIEILKKFITFRNSYGCILWKKLEDEKNDENEDDEEEDFKDSKIGKIEFGISRCNSFEELYGASFYPKMPENFTQTAAASKKNFKDLKVTPMHQSYHKSYIKDFELNIKKKPNKLIDIYQKELNEYIKNFHIEDFINELSDIYFTSVEKDFNVQDHNQKEIYRKSSDVKTKQSRKSLILKKLSYGSIKRKIEVNPKSKKIIIGICIIIGLISFYLLIR